MGDGLTVGRWALAPKVQVRILISQPRIKRGDKAFWLNLEANYREEIAIVYGK